jgi:hypothetical protein
MTSVSNRAVLRLTSPGDIVASVPALCGFRPVESVVVLSLRGPRRRLGLTIRVDLPPVGARPDPVPGLADLLAERVQADGGQASALVVFSAHRRPELAEAYAQACAGRGATVDESLHVVDGRWTSYTCRRSCCPAEGTPVPGPPELLVAEHVLDGRAVLASRADLVRALAAPEGLLVAPAAAQLEAAGARWLQERQSTGVAAARRRAVQRARALLDEVDRGARLDGGACAEFTVALHDVAVRDELATWALDRSDGLLSLTEVAARHAVPPHDAPVCTLLAWVSYARGDGARANVALDRALSTDPGYSLAVLLRRALDGGVTPPEVRRILRRTGRSISDGRPRR